MEYPLDEILDKRSIIQLKVERTNEEGKSRLEQEFKDYSNAIEEYIQKGVCTQKEAENWHGKLYGVNGRTWDLETKIRKGQIGDLSLEEIGKTAIAIRENNGKRISIKSYIVEKTGVGYTDIKINHASQKNF